MTFTEFNLWMEYFDQRPIGWREDDRTYKQLRAAGVKAEPQALFTSLAIMHQHQTEEVKAAVPRNGSFLHSMMMAAKGGDKVDILKDL